MVQEESREAVRRQILSRTRIQVLKTVVFFDWLYGTLYNPCQNNFPTSAYRRREKL